MRVSSRHHLRDAEIRSLVEAIEENLGVTVGGESFELVELEDHPIDVVLVDGEPLACYIGDDSQRVPFLTVRGANVFPPSAGTVTVDAGAISFVSDGADVMRPGIVDADSDIDTGDLVIVTEETHGKALAVGRARVLGSEMLGDSGKVVDSIHHVGDELFSFEP